MPTYNVNQMIQRLKKFPPSWKVSIEDSDRIHANCGVKKIKGDSEKKQVIIEETYLED